MAGLQYQDIVNAQGGTATNAQTGEVTTAPMTTINPQPTNPSAGQPVVINPVQTTGAPPLQLPQPDTNLATADATVTGSSQTAKTLQDYLNQLEAPKTALDGQNQALMDRLSSLYGSNVGRAQETAKLEDTSGLNTLKKQFADLNSQILTKNAEYLKLRDMTEQNSNLKGSFSAKDTQLARAQAADVGLLQARALGMQGQVNASQDAIDRAINLKYQGIEEEITAKEKQMALIAPLLTAQQAKQAQAQERMYADEKERIAEEKAKAKENITLAVQAGVQTRYANKNKEFFDVNSGIAYPDEESFFKAAGVKSFQEAYDRGLVTDINTSTKAEEINSILLEAAKNGADISTLNRIRASKSTSDAIISAGSYVAPKSADWKLQNVTDANGNSVTAWVNEKTRQIMSTDSSSAAPSIAAKYPDGSDGPGTGILAGECGAFINATVDLPTPNDTVGTSKAQKIANVGKYGVDATAYQSQGANVGDVIFFNIGEYGHVAAVNTVNPDGTVTVSESNYNMDGKVGNTRTVRLDDPSIIGAIRGSFKGGIQTSNPQTSSPIKLTNDQKQRLKIEGMSDTDINELTQYIAQNGIDKALSDLPLEPNERKAIAEAYLGRDEMNKRYPDTKDTMRLDDGWVANKFPYEVILSAGEGNLKRSGFAYRIGSVTPEEKYKSGIQVLLKAANDLRTQGTKDDDILAQIYKKASEKNKK